MRQFRIVGKWKTGGDKGKAAIGQWLPLDGLTVDFMNKYSEICNKLLDLWQVEYR